MNLYPTEDGFEDERELPENERGNNEDYSTNGLCPRCGLEIYDAHTGGACGEMRQYCPDDDKCGWCSDTLYDC